jgi:hypothetical protein
VQEPKVPSNSGTALKSISPSSSAQEEAKLELKVSAIPEVFGVDEEWIDMGLETADL